MIGTYLSLFKCSAWFDWQHNAHRRPSLFGGLDSGLDCGTGLWDWTQRKLR